MSTHAEVLALVVNWNGHRVLKRTIASLSGSDYPFLRIVVVDNASNDGSLNEIPPGIEVLRLTENLGYGGAINRAVQKLLTDTASESFPVEFFLVLNNDIQVRTSTISALVAFARKQRTGVYGPRVVQESNPDLLEAAWGRVDWSHVLAQFAGESAPKANPSWNVPCRVELLLGSAMLLHRDVFKQVGFFDERFFMYHEEVDFLYRAKLKGIPVFYVPAAEVIHTGAHGTRKQPLKKVFWTRKNAVLFLRKHHASPVQWAKYLLTLKASLLFNLILLRISRVRSIWQGVRAGFSVRLY